jgi:hypothetical protein
LGGLFYFCPIAFASLPAMGASLLIIVFTSVDQAKVAACAMTRQALL